MHQASEPRSQLALKASLLGALTLLTALVYWPALKGGFIFDDYPIFVENPVVHVTGWHFEAWLDILKWSHANIQRPLAMLTYAFNYALNSEAFGFKLTNLFIHLANVLLVFTFTNKITTYAWNNKEAPEKKAWPWAIMISAAWAIHPLHVSTVMYVVQRMELLGFTFTLLSLLAYWKARELQAEGQSGSSKWMLAACALTLIGFSAKETVALTPCYALLLELTILKFRALDHQISLRLRTTFIFTFTAGTIFVIFFLIPHYASNASFAGRDFNVWQRELTQLRALCMYISWIVAPTPSRLVFYYDNYQISTGLFSPLNTFFCAIFLISILALACRVRTKFPLFSLGIGWFFVAHAITSGPLALELVFEHRNYPALLGILLAIADLIHRLWQRSYSAVPYIAAGLLVFNLAYLTVIRALVWSNPLDLSTSLADYNPGSLRASMDLARHYRAMSKGVIDSPFYSLSVRELERAADIPADSPLPEEAMLLDLANRPGADARAWWDRLNKKLISRPLVPDTYLVLHKLVDYRIKGLTGIDANELAHSLSIAETRNPNRQSMQADYAELLGSALKNPYEAARHWQIALSLDPHPEQYASQLADYLTERQRYIETIAVIEKTFTLSPTSTKSASLASTLQHALEATQHEPKP